MSIKVKVKGLNEFRSNIKRSPRVFDMAMEKALELSAREVQKKSRRKAPVDTSRLKQSIAVSVRKLTAKIGPTVKYGIYVEEGTRPHFPPPAALKPWARKRGINEYALAKAISKRGTRAQPFMGPGFKESIPRIKFFMNKGMDAVLKFLAR